MSSAWQDAHIHARGWQAWQKPASWVGFQPESPPCWTCPAWLPFLREVDGRPLTGLPEVRSVRPTFPVGEEGAKDWPGPVSVGGFTFDLCYVQSRKENITHKVGASEGSEKQNTLGPGLFTRLERPCPSVTRGDSSRGQQPP